MLTPDQLGVLRAVASMSYHHGSYGYLVEGYDGWPCLAHREVGPRIFKFPEEV